MSLVFLVQFQALGTLNNNQGELLYLWMGLRLPNKHKVLNALVFRDSQVVIIMAYTNGNEESLSMHTLCLCIHSIIKGFSSIKLFHILRDFNHIVDGQENKGTKLNLEELMVNGVIAHVTLPPCTTKK